MPTKLYSKRDIQQHLEYDSALEIVEKTYVETANDRVLNPAKLTMHLGDDGEWPDMNAFAIDMPAYVGWLDVAGVKWAVATWDADKEIPISSQILLFDLDRGEFTSVMEGMYITGVRTALQSVVGLKHVYPSEPKTVGLFGAGFQAEFQVSVIDSLLDVDEISVFDVDEEAAETLVADLNSQTDAELLVADSPKTASNADAIVTVTDSKTPVLAERWLDDSAFIIALGSYQELTDETIHSSDHLIVDHPEQCLQRGALSDAADRGELTLSDLDATVGEILTGGYHEEISEDDRTIFVPIGLGSLDISIAESFHRAQQARSSDIREFAFESALRS